MDKKDIKNFTFEELKKELSKILVPSYRAHQIFSWLYKKGVSEFSGMDNMPDVLKNRLYNLYCIGHVKLREHLKSCDGTEKLVFELSDGNLIETVLITSGSRNTLCLSTQVGCRYACQFCASGIKGFKRNLTASEILDQILFAQHMIGNSPTNFVFMGIGEPLDNYEELSRSIMIMNCSQAMEIGARRITISSCGIIPGIEKLKHLGIQVNLSISLHAVNDELRSYLMPVNKIYPLEKLIASCKDYIDNGGRKITLEYVLIKGTNDSLKDAKGISAIAKTLDAKVNLIGCSPIPKKTFKAPVQKDIDIFKNRLIKDGINVTVRESKGKDIQGACGQLIVK